MALSLGCRMDSAADERVPGGWPMAHPDGVETGPGARCTSGVREGTGLGAVHDIRDEAEAGYIPDGDAGNMQGGERTKDQEEAEDNRKVGMSVIGRRRMSVTGSI